MLDFHCFVLLGILICAMHACEACEKKYGRVIIVKWRYIFSVSLVFSIGLQFTWGGLMEIKKLLKDLRVA